MIPLKEVRFAFEKKAGSESKLVWKGIKKIFKYPKTTAAIIGGLALSKAVSSIAKDIHPLHQIVKEEQKQKMFKTQNRILTDILKANREKPAKIKKQKLITTPLT